MPMLSEGLVILLPRTRRRHLYSKRPLSLRTPTCLSSTDYSQSVAVPCLVQVDVSYNPHRNFSSLRSCASPSLSASSSNSIPCLQFRTLPTTPSTSDNELTLRFPWFDPCRTARYCRTQWFSTNISHSTRANAPFPLPSCNHQESNETARLVIFVQRLILRN